MTYQEAFNKFKQKFMINKKSILTDEEILNEKNLQDIINNFVKNGDTSDKNFDEKIKIQLQNADENVIDLMANIIWLWRLPVYKADRKSSIKRFLQNFEKRFLENFEKTWSIHDERKPLLDDFAGFALTGTYYNTNKPFELAYIIKFLEKYLQKPSLEPIKILKDMSDKSEIIVGGKSERKTASMYNALLHLFDNENFMPIISKSHKELISNVFKEIYADQIGDETDIDKILKIVKECLEKANITSDFYADTVKNIWQGGLDFESKNIILHGAPGTGKTYTTLKTIKARKAIEKNSEYKLVQFHPSYGYEDFIDGVKPCGIENGVMKFELKNGVFKQMCIDAFRDLKENKEKAKKYYFIADEINRAELSRVFGELLLCLEDDKRLSFDKNNNLKGMFVKTANCALWDNEKHAVYIDEKGEGYFGVPENVYFIGTMNDIDKSVDSFDMTLRRRFMWKHYRCDLEVVGEKYKDDKSVDEYLKICKNLNEYITKDLGFCDDYELGQSYFMKATKLVQKELDKVWIEHIEPLLREYLRAQYSKNEINAKIDNAKKIFNLPTKENGNN